MAMIAPQRAPWSAFSALPRRIRYPAKMSQRTRVVFRRASPDHQTPQTGRAQIGPVTRTMVQNSTASSAEACATRSNRRSRLQR